MRETGHMKNKPNGFPMTILLAVAATAMLIPARLRGQASDPPAEYHGNYYVDPVNGSDEYSGHTPDEAWRTLASLDNLLLQPGDSLLFKSGGEWTGTFSVKGSGLPGKPVVIGRYGGEERPVIHGGGLAINTLSLINQHHLVLRDLAITNTGATEEFRRAVYYHAADMGEIRYIVFDNLEIYDVNGVIGDEATKDNGGIFIEISGSSVPTWFDTLIISNCYVHDVNRTGISNRSFWESRTLKENENWTPSRNVHIHHNTFERTGANALIVRVAQKPVMEYNLFTHCAMIGSGNASFSFNTDSAIWQFNEACFTKFNEGDMDAGGFDSDYRSKYTIIQYNYSHDNEYGGALLTGGSGTGTGFNEGTIIRYNVFANNRHHIIRTSGNATNSRIYNNVFYTSPALQDVYQVYHKSWNGYADGTFYWNNIFYNEGTGASFELESSTNNMFSHNIYYGNTFANRPIDPVMITEDPVLFDPEGDAAGFDAVHNFRICAGSSAIDRGMDIEGTVRLDIAGYVVPTGDAPDIGPFEYDGASGLPFHKQTDPSPVWIIPNPVRDIAGIRVGSGYTGWLELRILDTRMSLVKKYSLFMASGEMQSELNLGRIEPGFYFMWIRMDRGCKLKKFVIL